MGINGYRCLMLIFRALSDSVEKFLKSYLKPMHFPSEISIVHFWGERGKFPFFLEIWEPWFRIKIWGVDVKEYWHQNAIIEILIGYLVNLFRSIKMVFRQLYFYY